MSVFSVKQGRYPLWVDLGDKVGRETHIQQWSELIKGSWGDPQRCYQCHRNMAINTYFLFGLWERVEESEKLEAGWSFSDIYLSCTYSVCVYLSAPCRARQCLARGQATWPPRQSHDSDRLREVKQAENKKQHLPDGLTDVLIWHVNVAARSRGINTMSAPRLSSYLCTRVTSARWWAHFLLL